MFHWRCETVGRGILDAQVILWDKITLLSGIVWLTAVYFRKFSNFRRRVRDAASYGEI